jgi:membrane peptidoglycan carboxypeptidase
MAWWRRATIAFWISAAVALHASWGVAAALCARGTLAEIGPHTATTIVYDRQNRPAFFLLHRAACGRSARRVSPRMIDALLAVEDRRFFSHHGLDPARMMKAGLAQRARRPDRRRGEHADAAARASRAAHAGPHAFRARCAKSRLPVRLEGALLEAGEFFTRT